MIERRRDDVNLTRVGLLVPSSNTTIETELPDMLCKRTCQTGERFTFHSSRAELLQVDEDSLERMVADADRCVRELSDAHVDVLAYACLVAIMAQGQGAHVEAEERLARGAADNGAPAPVISSAGALIRGIEALGLRRVAIVTPYKESLTRLVADYIEGCGIAVVDARSLAVTENVAVGRLDPMNLVGIARELDTSTADGVVLSACVQMPSLPAIPLAEQEIGLPVLSAATATTWEILTALGRDPVVPDAGSLLSGDLVGTGIQ
jgi:maleate isomerase